MQKKCHFICKICIICLWTQYAILYAIYAKIICIICQMIICKIICRLICRICWQYAGLDLTVLYLLVLFLVPPCTSLYLLVPPRTVQYVPVHTSMYCHRNVMCPYVPVCTGMYNFDISRTASYPEEDVLVRTSTYHLVLPRTRGTGFQMNPVNLDTGKAVWTAGGMYSGCRSGTSLSLYYKNRHFRTNREHWLGVRSTSTYNFQEVSRWHGERFHVSEHDNSPCLEPAPVWYTCPIPLPLGSSGCASVR